MNDTNNYTKQLEEQVAALEDKLHVNDNELVEYSDLSEFSVSILSNVIGELDILLSTIKYSERDKEPEVVAEAKRTIVSLLQGISEAHYGAELERTLDAVLTKISEAPNKCWDRKHFTADIDGKQHDIDLLTSITPKLKEIINEYENG